MREQTAFSIFFSVIVCAWLVSSPISYSGPPPLAIGGSREEFERGTTLFVGDIMLGRHVETLMKEKGIEYPFLSVGQLLEHPTLTIGNFEGTVPARHRHTPDFTFQFSIREEYLSYLHTAGFDVLSLANNHTFDYGADGYEHTRAACTRAGIICGGHPYEFLLNGYEVVSVGDARLGILFIHATDMTSNPESLAKLAELAQKTSDVQVAYVHWGVEYERTHSKVQADIAHTLIDGGVDAIIGHHPHVVQDVEVYKGKPIYYSLGNFIFDQYFNDEVQEGLGVFLEITQSELIFRPVSFSSISVRSQPQLKSKEESEALLTRVFQAGDGQGPPFDATFKITVPW